MNRPSGETLRKVARVLFFIALFTGVIVYQALKHESASLGVSDYLPVVGVVSGPWLIGALVAWAGGLTVDAVMYGKPVESNTDSPPPPPWA